MKKKYYEKKIYKNEKKYLNEIKKMVFFFIKKRRQGLRILFKIKISEEMIEMKEE